MVSHPDVVQRLRQFVCIRLDHDQMQKHRGRLKTPTQGNQVLLTARGEYIPDTPPRGKRYDVAEFVRLLDRVLREYPPNAGKADDLRLGWFWWNPRDQGLPGHFGADAIGRLDRKPVLTVSGPVPPWLDRTDFLRKHQRQFIWTRGTREGPARLVVRMLEPDRKELLNVDLNDVRAESLGSKLDTAWLAYQKVRPLTARGYIDNAHGRWLKRVMEKAHEEELQTRKQALEGTLLPPGRAAVKVPRDVPRTTPPNRQP